MPAATKTIVYKDFDLSFRAHPKTGNLLMKKNNDSVKQGVKSLRGNIDQTSDVIFVQDFLI